MKIDEVRKMKCKHPKCNKRIPKILKPFGGWYGCCSIVCSNEYHAMYATHEETKTGEVCKNCISYSSSLGLCAYHQTQTDLSSYCPKYIISFQSLTHEK